MNDTGLAVSRLSERYGPRSTGVEVNNTSLTASRLSERYGSSNAEVKVSDTWITFFFNYFSTNRARKYCTSFSRSSQVTCSVPR